MSSTPKAPMPITGRELRWWFRGCLITFVFGPLVVFLLSSVGMVALLRAVA